MRNTDTLNGYRQYLRSTARIGSGLQMAALPLLLSGGLLLGMSLGHGSEIGERAGGSVVLAGGG
jgi:hypothetical protein